MTGDIEEKIVAASMVIKPSTNVTTTVDRHPEFFFTSTLVAIRVENVLFNVHKYHLMKSTTFSDMFSIGDESDSSSSPKEGSSAECPIVLNGVSASDFECLMTVLYASRFSTKHPTLELSLIIPAFRLANMWDFAELRDYLMPLAEEALSDVDRIAFAREFNLADWMVPAHANLCLRKEKITTQEASKLGIESLLFISRFREDYPKQPPYCSSCSIPRTWGRGRGTGRGVAVQAATRPMPSKSVVEKSVRDWLDGGCTLED
ncbi:The BTB (BR-C, ttk and bab)/POZ (Pox virus and Zinc finger) domain [Ceratobasidium sp. AG-Ba]|nr:The BTB (BR-C, ttk and bab)/POZ (Pox virus and Zinc finger) domain [Ceratobasidium sp. AG-Ba]QRW07312.1 The BTB (BR-C, ttk and bab)/POZ (Pox virus and Zinc finger) domain [Ceratobasidium sp. AG-Ba]